MPLIVIAGAPGTGKSTLLAELACLGHHTVSDTAREIIRERKAAGLPPRPTPLEFSVEILKRDSAKYLEALRMDGLVFFERCALEAQAMVRAAVAGENLPDELLATDLVFHEQVFVLPPWKEIYVSDTERDHSFEHAIWVHKEVMNLYSTLGYRILEVPSYPVADRAKFVLQTLTSAAGNG